jgi:hypothetical protein
VVTKTQGKREAFGPYQRLDVSSGRITYLSWSEVVNLARELGLLKTSDSSGSPRPPPKDIVKLDRRLEDRLRNLCALMITATNENAWMMVPELWLLTRQHLEDLRMICTGKLSGARDFTERRKARTSA